MNLLDKKTNAIDENLSNLLEDIAHTPKDKKVVVKFADVIKKYFQSVYLFEERIKHFENNYDVLINEFNKHQRKFISEAFGFENNMRSHIVQKRMRELFISALGEYIFESPIVKRAYEKPRGYPGDHLIFEMIYNNECARDGIGFFLDKWILNHTLTRGVVYRKNKIKKILKELIGNNRHAIDVLNIGCGSSREVRELISDKKMNVENVYFSCLDQDDEALNLSRKLTMEINRHVHISFKKQDILSICLNRRRNHISKKDIIYSIGVADYFLNTTLENFIRYSFDLLKPNGKLIIPLCSAHNPRLYVPLRWFCEWFFYYHNETDMRKYIKDELGIKKVKTIWEKRTPFFFVMIEK
ncbi:MAG: hypothetical protein AMK70_13760 [Nitrospira bacterium SG8_35_1]|nr:MAG: hypothetical protein AMK70_13760 [Nitrospira bacterium SG8_35_1]